MSKLFAFLNMSYCQSSFHIKQKMILACIQNDSGFYSKEKQETFGENKVHH